ncbi:monocarboxylate transporter 13-like [Anoplophora glabripennis]|uniref:monocarboxylate transporter 13-like n=1 Tax=Anoplophora glabripennis TaxID=217634 RepID=UPI00087423E9|nr:monocarboxylate transporter 13-like [Anoplophora glabripennis]
MSNEDVTKPSANEPLLEKTEADGNSTKPAIYGRSTEEGPKVKRNKSVVLLEAKNTRRTEKWKLVPPDGGWGWLVLFGATLVNVLVPGTIKSFGVLFVEFLEAFKASTAEAMWIPALCYFLYSSLGPISSILSVKYSYRIVTVLGGIFAAAGMILSFWANSVYYLYFTYGVLVGCGAGLSFPPTVYIVCSYFVRLRGVANGICISGSAFGSILIPPLLRLLLVTYGYRGAVLIMGGITLNVFVAALFYDKVELHMKRVKVEPEQEEEIDQFQAKFIISQDSMPSLHHIPHNDSFLEHIENSEGNFNRSVSSATVQNLKSQYRERKISMPTGKNEVMKVKAGHGSKYNMSSNSTLHAVPEKENGNNAMDMYSHGRLPNSRRRTGVPKRSTSTSSFQYVTTPYHGSTLTLQPEIFASSFSLRSSTKTPEHKDAPKKTKLFDISLLKDPLYLIILISNATNAISYTNFIILLPSYAQFLGFNKDQGALLLSIVSALDLVGRIGGSALSDLTSFPKCFYFVGGLFISGITLSLMPLFGDFWVIAAFCSLFGLASGTYVGITAIVMADMLGEERLQSTYGMGLFVNGIIQLIGPPLCGIWYEMTNSFISLFISLGIIIIVGSMLWIFVPFLKREPNSNDVEDESP